MRAGLSGMADGVVVLEGAVIAIGGSFANVFKVATPTLFGSGVSIGVVWVAVECTEPPS